MCIRDSFLPVLLIIGFWLFMMRQMQGGGGGKGAMSFGRSRAKLQGEDQIKVTFADVAGCDEAKDEVGELVEFLRDPSRFTKPVSYTHLDVYKRQVRDRHRPPSP